MRRLALVGASLVLAGGLTACGSPPDDADKDEFCDAYSKVGESGGDFDDYKDAMEELADIGTPEEIDGDAREGFELIVDAVDDSGDEDELEEKGDDFSDDDEDKANAFGEKAAEVCAADWPDDRATDRGEGRQALPAVVLFCNPEPNGSRRTR